MAGITMAHQGIDRVQLHWSTARYLPWQELPLIDGLANLLEQGEVVGVQVECSLHSPLALGLLARQPGEGLRELTAPRRALFQRLQPSLRLAGPAQLKSCPSALDWKLSQGEREALDALALALEVRMPDNPFQSS